MTGLWPTRDGEAHRSTKERRPWASRRFQRVDGWEAVIPRGRMNRILALDFGTGADRRGDL